jgi:hypothetical protein
MKTRIWTSIHFLRVSQIIKLWGYYKHIFQLSYSTVNNVLKNIIVNSSKTKQNTIFNEFRLGFNQVYLILLLYYNKTLKHILRILYMCNFCLDMCTNEH